MKLKRRLKNWPLYTVIFLTGLWFLTFQACGKPFVARTISSLSSAAVTPPIIISDVAPDASLIGPKTTTEGEYQLPPQTDSTVLPGRQTELWARIYRPSIVSSEPLPILVFLHGNHGTCGVPSATPGGPRIDNSCQYTDNRTCPTGSVVTPNHLGYAYLAQRLASWGYFVVSINANLSITCGDPAAGDDGLILARGRLVLRHLQELSMWNANGGAPASLGFDPRGKLDFSQVGMMGHSRGGEGVRAAYNLYRDNGSPWPTRILAPVTFRGVFEIAPVDGQSDRVLDADGTAWAVLLPMCDGDVSDLQGVLPFDRMVTRALGANAPTERPPNTAISVWGANHNFYNTEWQTSDSNGCRNHTALWSGTEIGSAKQRQTALATLMAFFRTHVGNTQEDFGRNLDGAFQLPASASTITRVDRTFVKSATDESTLSLERFNRTAPQGSLGLTHVTSQVTLAYENRFPHDLSLRVGKIGWQNASNDTFLQFRLANGPPGINLSLMESLDFDLSRPEDPRNMANVPTDFEVRIADTMGRISSPLILRDFFNLIGPAGNSEGQLPVVTSVRLPLSRFTGVDLSKIAMVQLTFNRTAQGAIYLANLRASDNQTPTLYTTPLLPISLLPSQTSGMMLAAPVSTNELKRSRLVGMKAIGSETGVPMTEIEVFRESGFPITNALPSIKVGEQEFYSGRYGPNGDTRRMIFRIPSAAATLIRSNQPATVRFGSDSNKAISISLTPE